MEAVPIQYFQSVIVVELAVTGALLFQIRYFAPRGIEEGIRRNHPIPGCASPSR
jgi:hypothetical protein